MLYKKLEIRNDGETKAMRYENNKVKLYRELNDDEYHKLLAHFRPNNEMSLPDRLANTFFRDGRIIPSMKPSFSYNNSDFNEMVKSIRGDVKYVSDEIAKKRQRILNKVKRSNKTKNTNKKGKNIKKRIIHTTTKKNKVTPKKVQQKRKLKEMLNKEMPKNIGKKNATQPKKNNNKPQGPSQQNKKTMKKRKSLKSKK